MKTLVGETPKHYYVWVDSNFTHKEPIGFIPAVWFGLVSYPNRLWGCTVLLESGAIYRNLPPHALAFNSEPVEWTEYDCASWDCYSWNFTAHEYQYLVNMECKVRANEKDYWGYYLFSVAPVGDGFSADPTQAKEFLFIKLNNGRLTIQPTNHIIVNDSSFIENSTLEFPKGLKRQSEIISSEKSNDL